MGQLALRAAGSGAVGEVPHGHAGSPVKPPPRQNGCTFLSPTLFPFRWGAGAAQGQCGKLALGPRSGVGVFGSPHPPLPLIHSFAAVLWALGPGRGPRTEDGRRRRLRALREVPRPEGALWGCVGIRTWTPEPGVQMLGGPVRPC